MDLGIKDKLALVTGASRGIGRAIAGAIAREGARMILVARDAQKLEELQRELPGPAASHLCLPMDLMAAGAPEKLAKAVLSERGAPDIVVHNLGGSLGIRDAFSPSEVWAKVWQLNLGIVVDLNRVFIPAMIEKKWGRVVHLSTLSTATYLGNAPYVSAKCALDAYVKNMGREVAKHNVILSSVAPGAIYTEGRYFAQMMKENPAFMDDYYRNHLPAGRLGTAEEVGQVAAFLCSRHAAFMTGANVGIDGGGM